MLIKRKKAPRLSDFPYSGNYAYFVTCSTFQKSKYFSDKKVVSIVLDVLQNIAVKYDFSILIYCFMPDHLHLLLEGQEDASLTKLMKQFKQSSSYKYRNLFSGKLWQNSYYDHILRKEENLLEVALYILNNPVRKGLVNDYRDYDFLGSLVFDIKELSI